MNISNQTRDDGNFVTMHTSNDTFPSSPDNVCASFDYNPIAEGSRFDVYKASMFISFTYESKEKAVVKASRGSHADQEFWDTYLGLLEHASHTVAKFGEEVHGHELHLVPISFSKCYASAMDTTTKLNTIFGFFKGYRKHIRRDEYVLIEPFIEGQWEKFIECNGEVHGTCPELLQAFSHFSYHQSNGELVICGLKGSFHEGHYKLTVPCIHSVDSRYGSNDHGEEGISRFFAKHKCNNFCKSWLKLSDEKK